MSNHKNHRRDHQRFPRPDGAQSEGAIFANTVGVCQDMEAEGKHLAAASLATMQAKYIGPKNASSLLAIAAYCHRIGNQYHEGLKCAETAIKKWPDNPRAYYEKVENLLCLRRHEEALPFCQFALKKFPEDFPLHQALAKIYKFLGHTEQWQKAEQDVKKLSCKIRSENPLYPTESLRR